MFRPVLIAFAAALAPAVLLAQPSPVTAPMFDFPGSVAGPASATSAGVGLADRWLADAPFDNPAVPAGGAAEGSAQLLRISRQDLRAGNRDYDEQLVFIDGAGAWAGLPLRGMQVSLYAHQPVLRLEDYAFLRGRLASSGPPAILQGTASERELRSGLAVSAPLGALRLGAAGEWTRRDDTYETEEQSGGPDEGLRHVDFSGGAPGFQFGARFERGGGGPGSVTAGAALRWLPELDLEGDQEFELATGDSTGTVRATRESGWEGGVSVRTVVAPAVRVVVGAGARTAREWSGFDVVAGRSFSWGLGVDYHEAGTPWTARLGLGEEQADGVPEPRAGVVGLGLGWQFGESALDVGLLRRSIERAQQPTSFDYRLIVSYLARY